MPSTVYYYGDAVAIEDEWQLTPGNVGVGNTFTATINSKDITVTAVVGTVAEITGLLADAINTNADQIPEFSEVVAVDNTTYVAVTSRDPGNPIGLSSSASGGTATLVAANTVPATGPEFFDNADNYSGNQAPVNGDTVVHVRGNIRYALSTGVALAGFYKQRGSGVIGLPEQNTRGTGYDEYRETYLTFTSCTVLQLDDDANQVKINVGTAAACTAVIRQSGRREDTAIPAILIQGGHASAVMNIMKGDVGIAALLGESANWPVITVGYMDDQQGDVSLVLGSGLSTVTTYRQNGGKVETSAAITTMTQFAGTCTRLAGAIGSLIANGGTYVDRSEAAISTIIEVSSGATADFGRDLRSMTVAAAKLYAGGTFLDPNSRLTLTTGISLIRCKLADVVLDLGDHRNLVVTAAA